MPYRFLERPHAVGAWVPHPLQPLPPGTEAAAQAADEGSTDSAVAAADPLVGLLRMQVGRGQC